MLCNVTGPGFLFSTWLMEVMWKHCLLFSWNLKWPTIRVIIRRNAMARQFSFTKYEHEALPDFRKKLNLAETTEDVINFFVYTIKELFESIFGDKVDFNYEDITLILGREPHFKVSRRLFSSEDFRSVWNDSDLDRVIGRFAKSAMHRYNRLEKYSEKTDTKIRK
jgi:hypothetical protein